MTKDKFIMEYDTAGNKDLFIKDRIKNKYVSYSKKLSECKRIINSSCYVKNKDGKLCYRRNTPAKFFLFMMCLLENYTDIEIDYQNFVDFYDELNKRNIFAQIIQAIEEREYSEFKTILEMVDDDMEENERNLISFVENKMEPLQLFLEEAIKEIGEQNGSTRKVKKSNAKSNK